MGLRAESADAAQPAATEEEPGHEQGQNNDHAEEQVSVIRHNLEAVKRRARIRRRCRRSCLRHGGETEERGESPHPEVRERFHGEGAYFTRRSHERPTKKPVTRTASVMTAPKSVVAVPRAVVISDMMFYRLTNDGSAPPTGRSFVEADATHANQSAAPK